MKRSYDDERRSNNRDRSRDRDRNSDDASKRHRSDGRQSQPAARTQQASLEPEPEEGEITATSPAPPSKPASSIKESTKAPEPPSEPDYDALYSLSAVSSKPKTAAELIEEKKRKRAAILAKHRQRLSVTPGPSESAAPSPVLPPSTSATSLPTSLPGTPAAGLPAAVRALKVEGSATPEMLVTSPSSATVTRAATPGSPAVELANTHEDDLMDLRQSDRVANEASEGKENGEQDVSAAEYNADEDLMQEDRKERERLHLNDSKAEIKLAQPSMQQAMTQRAPLPIHAIEDDEPSEEDEEDDDDDMFAVKKPKKPRRARPTAGSDDASTSQASTSAPYVPIIDRSAADGSDANGATGTLIVDNYDDPEGYYRVLLGELLGENGRYHVQANLGKGMYSNVVRARDTQASASSSSSAAGMAVDGAAASVAAGTSGSTDVAIKIIRSQESMYRAGQKEATVLRKILEADPSDKKHLIRLHRTFEHKGHLCLVFENLSMNLRDVVKKFGKDVGINLKAVRAYSGQIFQAMNLLRKLNIIHADFKPDNILVNESKSTLKVCDLGSASDTSEAEITPYLVSRFYRAPEIILGLPYDCSLDMWSIACTLYELYTGKILFPGRSNNHMLLLIQDLKGRYPARLVKKAKFGNIHFEESSFVSVEKDKKTGNESIKKIVIPPQAKTDLKSRLMPLSTVKKLPEDEVKLLGNFVDLLNKALELDPAKRLTPKEALNHPFLR